MKKSIILASLVVATCFASAQTKHLPSTVTLKLTDKEVLRLDSAVNFANNSLDSKNASKWFMGAFLPFYKQVESQLVVDSAKVVKPVIH